MGILALGIEQGLAGKVYSIQCGEYHDAASVEVNRTRLEKYCSPVYVKLNRDDSQAPAGICIGRFSRRVEAFAYASLLDAAAFPQWDIVEIESGETDSEPCILPIELSFDVSGLSDSRLTTSTSQLAKPPTYPVPTTDTLRSSPEALDAEKLLSVGYQKNDRALAIRALEIYLERYPNASDANWARYTLALHHFREKRLEDTEALLKAILSGGDSRVVPHARLSRAYTMVSTANREEAQKAFHELANDPSLPAPIRLEAMSRFARFAHSRGMHAEAWLAFDQWKKHARTPVEAAEAEMQQAGLAFELVARGGSTWQETRDLCDRVVENPDAPHSVKATAALMNLEAYYCDGKTTEALHAAEAFCREYYDVHREYSVGLSWLGTILSDLRCHEESEKVFMRLMEMDISATQKFRNVEPQAAGAFWLAWLAGRKGDMAGRDSWLQVLHTRFPHSRQAKEAEAFFQVNNHAMIQE
jgi:tetratricopeptide (TPR) repeat protein